jgi:adenylate cyclase class 2
MIETELKLALPQPGQILARLQAYPLLRGRHLEDNLLLDRAGALRAADSALRLRHACGQTILTYKGPQLQGSGRLKQRQEWECRLEQGAALEQGSVLEQIFAELGYLPVFRYQKYRTEFRYGEQTTLFFDETPIGTFLEIEGPAERIAEAAQALGVAELPPIVDSYPKIYARRRRPEDPRDMVFAVQPSAGNGAHSTHPECPT